jgi:transcriptional regulator with XRE-family HTH domain
MTIGEAFGRLCRDTRIGLDLTQEALGSTVGVSRGYVANIEAGRSNVSINVVERIGAALGLSLELVATPPIFIAQRHSHDLVHAHCGGSVSRRLITDGWQVHREVDVADGRVHGWIDLLAFHPVTHTLLVIEIKTRLDDLGAMQRQLGWYERHARQAAAQFDWAPRQTVVWLVCLFSEEVDRLLQAHRNAFDHDFPGRAHDMLAVARGSGAPVGRGVAMIDPSSRRADWLITTRIDGRRSRPAYDGYADAARRLSSTTPRR